MGAATYDLHMDQGSSFTMEFQFTLDGSPLDLTNYLVRAQMRTHKKSSEVAANFVCSVVDATLGKISIAISQADREALVASEYLYDIEIYLADESVVQRMLQGKVFVDEGVTR
jgi:hypothetical protein